MACCMLGLCRRAEPYLKHTLARPYPDRMHPRPIDVSELPANNPTYSQAVRLGNLLFVSGQLGVDPATRALVPGGIREQTRQAIDNIEVILTAAGSALNRVAKVNIFLTDFSLLQQMNEVNT